MRVVKPAYPIGGGQGGDVAVGASTTTYADISRPGTFNATEANTRWYLTHAVVLSKAGFRTSTTQSGTGALTYTLRKNGADTALTIVVAANSAAGYYSNNTMEVAYEANDYVTVKMVNAASASSATIRGGGIYASGRGNSKRSRLRLSFLGCGLGSGITASTTRYWFLFQHSNTTAVETAVQGLFTVDMVIKNATFRTLGAQPATGSIVLTLRADSVDTGLAVTIAANSAAGVYQTNTPTVNVPAGTPLAWKVVNNATGTSATFIGHGIFAYV